MDSEKKLSFKKIVSDNYYLLFVLIAIILIALLTFIIYNYTKNLLRERLDERLKGIAATAALQFDGDQISFLAEEKLNAVKTKIYKSNVLKLQSIRGANSDIQYSYIFAQTNDPNKVFYVVDADAMSIFPTIDFNGDGKVNDEDVSIPGEVYDAADVPALHGEAFKQVTVDTELSVDTWGTFLSAYAPIYNSNGKVVGALTIDVEVSNFVRIVNATFLPFALFIALLILSIVSLTISLVGTWKSKVNAVKELDRQKDAVLHMVAHQFKGPVTTINFTTELLLDGSFGQLTSDQTEQVTTIRTASQKMGSQSEMVLDAAKITLGKLPLEPGPLDLNELFKEVVAEAENHAKEKKVHLKVSLPTSRLPTVVLDRKYTQLSIDNLLSNAVKYTALKTEGGNAEFTVEINDKVLRCTVKDTGIGIPKSEQENIFKELYRASNAGKDGNGLGLHVTKGSIEAQGGKIWFESEEGKGTTFFFELPIKLANVT